MDETTQQESHESQQLSGASLVNEVRERYRAHAQLEHGSVINPITGEEVDIMQQCVNLQLDIGSNHEVGDTDAYREVVTDFAEQLTQGMTGWVVLSNGQYRKGRINRVNVEDKNTVTYDFEYMKGVVEGGKRVDKMFIIKDLARSCIKTQQLLVKGDPAGGKTTFAKQLLTWVLRNEATKWLVPVLIRTVDLVRCRSSFVESGTGMVDQYLAMRYAEIGLYQLFQQARTEGRLMIILDGFDEAGPSERKLIAEIRDNLLDSCFIVLTSRDMGSTFDKSEFERFRSVRVKELNEEQQRQVIQRRLITDERVDRFCMQLTLNPALGHMAKNPLLLNVSLAVFESSNLSEGASINRGKVYSIALDGMLGNIEKAKGPDIAITDAGEDVKRSISAKALREVLKQVAFLAHTSQLGSGIRDFRRDLIERAVKNSGVGAEFTMDHWNDIEEIIKKGRLPVLTWFTEKGEDTFRFAHLTFQEFLCAEQCLQRSMRDEDFIEEWKQMVCPNTMREIISRGWWQQTLQMFCDLAMSCSAKSKSGKFLVTLLGETFFGLSEDDDYALDFPEGVNDTNILTIVSMLQMNTTLEHMTLGKAISSSGISTLRSLNLESLQTLCLRGNQIGPEGCMSIAHFLESSRSPLQTLDLSSNIICQGEPKEDMPPKSMRNPHTGHYDSHLVDFRGFDALLRLMQVHPTLRQVDFRGNFLNVDAGRKLSEVVLANEKLEEVCGIPVSKIRAGGLTEIEFENRPYFILVNRTPERFLSSGDAELLLELLLRFPQPLEKLKLQSQALASDTDGVVELFDKLGTVVAAAAQLELLDLSGFWDCGATAGKALGQKIKDHAALKELKIGTGILEFDAIQKKGKSSRPEGLVLTGTAMRDCGAGILSECLPQNICKLDVRRSGIGASGYKLLSQCAHLEDINGIELKSFTEECSTLDLSRNPLNSSGAMACIIARTTLTPNLTYLDLSGSNLTSKSHVHKLAPVIGGRSSTGCDGGCDVSAFAGTNAYKNCADCDLDFCSTCCMSECPMVSLAEAIQRLPHLTTLKISNCAFEGGRNGPVRSHLDEEGYRILGIALSKHEKLLELDISNNYFEGPGFPHLAEGIAMMPTLKTLYILPQLAQDFRQWLEDAEIKVTHSSEALLIVLSRAIARNPHLRELDLSLVERRDFTLRAVHVLVESLDSLRGGTASTASTDMEGEIAETAPKSLALHMLNLHQLDLRECSLEFSRLQEGLLSSLDLSKEVLMQGEAYALLFALAISVSDSLVEIDLSNWEFASQTKTVVSVVQLLASRGILQRYNKIPLQLPHDSQLLCLDEKPVMPHGICVLASVTLANSHITQLDVSHCSMDAGSLGILLASIRERQTVTSLDISYQPLGRLGVQELANHLRVDKKLHELTARNIAMPHSRMGGEMLAFATALESNVTLATLDIRENAVDESIAERLRRTMEEKRKVVPFPIELKYFFLLCNKHLPYHMQLPEVVQVAEVSNLFSDGAHSPLVLIFQYCARVRELLLDPANERKRLSAREFGPGWQLQERFEHWWAADRDVDPFGNHPIDF